MPTVQVLKETLLYLIHFFHVLRGLQKYFADNNRQVPTQVYMVIGCEMMSVISSIVQLSRGRQMLAALNSRHQCVGSLGGGIYCVLVIANLFGGCQNLVDIASLAVSS